ncbi:MAG: LCP family protein [Clostridia bacterium]|nr:LCP family protein [Clostridia bacterium]
MGSEQKEIMNEVYDAPVKEEKKKKKKFLIILLPFFIIFLVLVIGVAGFVGYKFSLIEFDDTEKTTIDINQEFFDDETIDFDEIDDATGRDFREILKNWATKEGEKMSEKDVINILLIGSDASSKDPNRANVTEKGNTDVMMLVSINPMKQTIKLVSFMRDSYTYMDQFDRYAKLNAACANGGPGYLVETIENDYKIKIDGYVMVDFDSFVKVIDVLGGVTVNVPAYVANHLGHGFPSGNNVLLDGQQALRFSRVRYSDKDGDISRVARQRQVINSLINRCKGATLSEINAVSDVILANIRTNISRRAILSYAAKAVADGWPNFTVTEMTMPTPETRMPYSSRATAWIWVVDYPLAAQQLQLELYGKTNIKLEENRKTAITVMGGR